MATRDSLGNHKNSKYEIILIGNKVDLIGVDDYVREVNEDEAKNFCEEYCLIWGGETSVKNIEDEINEIKKKKSEIQII